MKRVLCVLLLLALTVPVLLIPARAAEEYVFEWINPEVMMLDEFSSFFPINDTTFMLADFLLPEGVYEVSFSPAESDGFRYYIDQPVTVAFGDVDGIWGSLSECKIVYSVIDVVDTDVFGSIPVNFLVAHVAESTVCQFFDDTWIELPLGIDFDSIILTPVSPMQNIQNGFASLDSTLDSVFQLIQENVLLASFAAAGLILVCVPIFIELKKSAR